MSKCISVTLSDGSTVSANVDDDVNELPPEDVEALEACFAAMRAKRKKQKETQNA